MYSSATVAIDFLQCGHGLLFFVFRWLEKTKTPLHDGQRTAALLP